MKAIEWMRTPLATCHWVTGSYAGRQQLCMFSQGPFSVNRILLSSWDLNHQRNLTKLSFLSTLKKTTVAYTSVFKLHNERDKTRIISHQQYGLCHTCATVVFAGQICWKPFVINRTNSTPLCMSAVNHLTWALQRVASTGLKSCHVTRVFHEHKPKTRRLPNLFSLDKQTQTNTLKRTHGKARQQGI